MDAPRISASSYSNTAPLVWSYQYGSDRGKVEMILDTAPARSAELLARDRVDAALVPVIAYQMIPDVRLVPNVCVGTRDEVRSVCLVTRERELADVRSVSLDVSSRTSAVLTKIIFREFMASEPVWTDAEPDIEQMLERSDCALLIGDPALRLSGVTTGDGPFRVFDLAGLWRRYTSLGFVFAMWMTRRDRVPVDLAAARDEGLENLASIARNYAPGIGLAEEEIVDYLTNNIAFSIDASMKEGMELYFRLAEKHRLIEVRRDELYIEA